MNESDLKKILEFPISDISYVYGGVRGRTMSSQNQFLWHHIKTAGVKTIIGLREGGLDTRIVTKCIQNDLGYFYYPVDNHAGSISKMVELFPEFCRLIDEGDFYISCAMGFHRTDIALCCYWMFLAADYGIAPPEIRGYGKEDGTTFLRLCVFSMRCTKNLNVPLVSFHFLWKSLKHAREL